MESIYLTKAIPEWLRKRLFLSLSTFCPSQQPDPFMEEGLRTVPGLESKWKFQGFSFKASKLEAQFWKQSQVLSLVHKPDVLKVLIKGRLWFVSQVLFLLTLSCFHLRFRKNVLPLADPHPTLESGDQKSSPGGLVVRGRKWLKGRVYIQSKSQLSQMLYQTRIYLLPWLPPSLLFQAWFSLKKVMSLMSGQFRLDSRNLCHCRGSEQVVPSGMRDFGLN